MNSNFSEASTYEAPSLTQDEIKKAQAGFITKVYSWMTLALVITGLVAIVTASTPSLLNAVLGNKIIFFGNGGSAADAQHIATELVVRYKKNRKSIPAISLSTDTSTLTAIGNDFSFNRIFSRQIESIGKNGDVAVGISTSGKSPNILNALDLAKRKKIISVLLTKKNYPNKKKINRITDIVLGVPAKETARVQELHILLGHLLCAALDESFN